MDPVTLGIVGGSVLAGAGSSLFNAHSQASSARKLTKLNYEYGQKSLIASPTHYKEGLELAGINPILASDSPVGSTQGSTGISPNMDLAGDLNKGFSAKMLKDQTESNVELQGKQGEAALKNAEANKTQAEAAKKNADTNEKMLIASGVNAGSNAVGTIGNLIKGIFGGKSGKGGKLPLPPISSFPTKGASAKGVKGAVGIPTPSSASSVSKASTVLPAIATALAPGLTNYGTAAGLALPAAYYGIGKYLESKGHGKTIDKGPNKNELRHRTGGLGNSSIKTKTSTRRHN